MILKTLFGLEMQRLVAGAAPRVAVAVSGGGDSMALALLMQDWLQAAGGEMLALTVDHGLRPEARAEAAETGRRLAARGIRHRILTWAGDKPATHIQEEARAARYRLLQAACREEDFSFLAVAHNLEDQAETFWMRLAHGSGLNGLAAMAPARQEGGVTILRPLLAVSRAALRAYCRAAGVAWIEDPSNANEKFLRPRLRAFEEALAAEGFTPQRLGQTARKLAAARDALEWLADKAFADCAAAAEANTFALHRDKWLAYPADIRRRLLARLIQSFFPGDYPPGADALQQLESAIAAPDFPGRTLGGCLFTREKKGVIAVRAEMPARQASEKSRSGAK